jgi:hypothetical protein
MNKDGGDLNHTILHALTHLRQWDASNERGNLANHVLEPDPWEHDLLLHNQQHQQYCGKRNTQNGSRIVANHDGYVFDELGQITGAPSSFIQDT